MSKLNFFIRELWLRFQLQCVQTSLLITPLLIIIFLIYMAYVLVIHIEGIDDLFNSIFFGKPGIGESNSSPKKGFTFIMTDTSWAEHEPFILFAFCVIALDLFFKILSLIFFNGNFIIFVSMLEVLAVARLFWLFGMHLYNFQKFNFTVYKESLYTDIWYIYTKINNIVNFLDEMRSQIYDYITGSPIDVYLVLISLLCFLLVIFLKLVMYRTNSN